MTRLLASDCHAYLGGCHPHHHAWIHGHGVGGGLLFVLFAIIIGHRITDGEWG
jgi:hypothetical protein